ncbi:uncharacterized protein LOC119689239 isoform X2 [Teleopsis dalmanni]|uniref:uncharacterized protein LOC119689239 isoform X2 n=1 Tax=Teleopsis dalmanni TaxID=139649 RepID=UPI0018CFB829|nr:uncharacterized protein LOC119689239 isoform X2 [Teleopsis dalmanni]
MSFKHVMNRHSEMEPPVTFPIQIGETTILITTQDQKIVENVRNYSYTVLPDVNTAVNQQIQNPILNPTTNSTINPDFDGSGDFFKYLGQTHPSSDLFSSYQIPNFMCADNLSTIPYGLNLDLGPNNKESQPVTVGSDFSCKKMQSIDVATDYDVKHYSERPPPITISTNINKAPVSKKFPPLPRHTYSNVEDIDYGNDFYSESMASIAVNTDQLEKCCKSTDTQMPPITMNTNFNKASISNKCQSIPSYSYSDVEDINYDKNFYSNSTSSITVSTNKLEEVKELIYCKSTHTEEEKSLPHWLKKNI